MKKTLLFFLLCTLSYALCTAQTSPRPATDTEQVIAMLRTMYQDTLYEDYTWIESHCTPRMLQRLQQA